MGAIVTPLEVGSVAREPKRTLRGWFLGADGIRAGWSALIFLTLVVVPLLATRVPVNKLLQDMRLRPSLEPWAPAVAEAWRFALGVAAGIAALSALVLALKMSGLLIFDGQVLHGRVAWMYGFQWGVAFLLTGLFEESLLRGYLQATLARGIGFWWAALLLSVGFGALHLPNNDESPIGILSAAAIGLVFCLSLWLTKSLYWAVGLHAGWDWAESYFYGVPDSGKVATGHLFATHPSGGLIWSGGPTGPEGSIYVIPIVALIALGVWIAWGRVTAFPSPRRSSS